MARKTLKNRRFVIRSEHKILTISDTFIVYDFYSEIVPCYVKVFYHLYDVEARLLRLRLNSSAGTDYTLVEIKSGERMVRLKSKPRTKPAHYFRKLTTELAKL